MSTFGWPHRHLRRCTSTNDVARKLALAGAPGGTVVTAEEQTAGRGRQGRAWTTVPGASLAYSAILRTTPITPLLPLAVAVAVCEAIEALTPAKVSIKWPNDIWIEEKKCAGILAEARPQDGWAVIGVGLNLDIADKDLPPDARVTATSIGQGVTPRQATAALNDALTHGLGLEADSVAEAFRARDALRGKQVRWAAGSGQAEGIDEAGNLLVRDDEGAVHALSAGEVHLLR